MFRNFFPGFALKLRATGHLKRATQKGNWVKLPSVFMSQYASATLSGTIE